VIIDRSGRESVEIGGGMPFGLCITRRIAMPARAFHQMIVLRCEQVCPKRIVAVKEKGEKTVHPANEYQQADFI
jgi:hypothetical protein